LFDSHPAPNPWFVSTKKESGRDKEIVHRYKSGDPEIRGSGKPAFVFQQRGKSQVDEKGVKECREKKCTFPRCKVKEKSGSSTSERMAFLSFPLYSNT